MLDVHDCGVVHLSGVNQVLLLGRVGQDPQIRGSTENTVVVFPLATSYTLKTRDGW